MIFANESQYLGENFSNSANTELEMIAVANFEIFIVAINSNMLQ